MHFGIFSFCFWEDTGWTLDTGVPTPSCATIFITGCHFIFIHSIGMYSMWRFLAILRSFFCSSLLCTFSCHPAPPTNCPSSLTLSCHLFLGLPLSLVVTKFICNTLSGILFSSILCTWPNQHNLFNLIVSIIVTYLLHGAESFLRS